MTYLNGAAASAAGVRWLSGPAADSPCGAPVSLNPNVPNGPPVIFCGSDSQCPAPQACCAITGRCVDPATPGLCTSPSAGADNPCITTAECQPDKYCKGSAPCDSVGMCVPPPKCDVAVLSPVCGCDGVTYANEGCAASDGMRVETTGACIDGG